jgi:hypothetical protein
MSSSKHCRRAIFQVYNVQNLKITRITTFRICNVVYQAGSRWDPKWVFDFLLFFVRTLYKSNYIIFILSWRGTHTKIRSKLVDIVTAGSQKITLWGPQRTPLGILRVKLSCREASDFEGRAEPYCDLPCVGSVHSGKWQYKVWENTSFPYSLLTYTLMMEAEYSSVAVIPIISATCFQHSRPQYVAKSAFLVICAPYYDSWGVDGKIILKWIVEKSVAKDWNEFICLRIRRSDVIW